jgi:hypothetical protein
VQQVGLAREAVIVSRRRRAGEAPDQLEIAIDLFLGEEAVEILARELGLGQDRGRAGLPEAFGHLGKAQPEIAAGDAAIARRGALARLLPVEHLHRASGPRQRDRSREAGIAGPHDDDVASRVDRRSRGLRQRRCDPPIGIPFHHDADLLSATLEAAAIDRQDLAGDPTGLLARQEQGG